MRSYLTIQFLAGQEFQKRLGVCIERFGWALRSPARALVDIVATETLFGFTRLIALTLAIDPGTKRLYWKDSCTVLQSAHAPGNRRCHFEI